MERAATDIDFAEFAMVNLRSWNRVWGLGLVVSAGLLLLEVAHGLDSPLFLIEVLIDIADLALLAVIWRRRSEWRGIVAQLEAGEQVIIAP